MYVFVFGSVKRPGVSVFSFQTNFALNLVAGPGVNICIPVDMAGTSTRSRGVVYGNRSAAKTLIGS